ncbi:MAG: hypothetical protein WC058_04680 [Phycisphaeraceae bacterium]
MTRNRLMLSVLAMTLLIPMIAMAQDTPQNNDGQGRGWRFDPAQMRQRMMERIKTELKATDEEWTVLQPKVEKVMTLQRDLMMSMFGGRMGRRAPGTGAPGGPGGDNAQPSAGEASQSEIVKATTDLRTALADDNTPAATLNEKLLAFRTARAKVRTELDVARKDLRELLTPRQEAVLVVDGMLE